MLHESPGVGHNLFNHPVGTVTFRVNDHVSLDANAGALRLTSEPPSYPNDAMLHCVGVFNIMTGEMAPERSASIAEPVDQRDGGDHAPRLRDLQDRPGH